MWLLKNPTGVREISASCGAVRMCRRNPVTTTHVKKRAGSTVEPPAHSAGSRSDYGTTAILKFGIGVADPTAVSNNAALEQAHGARQYDSPIAGGVRHGRIIHERHRIEAGETTK